MSTVSSLNTTTAEPASSGIGRKRSKISGLSTTGAQPITVPSGSAVTALFRCRAFVNGTAAHGEDFDDTFEGGPVHAGAVIVPAVLAVAERHGVDGKSALEGIAVGIELMCRLGLVAP